MKADPNYISMVEATNQTPSNRVAADEIRALVDRLAARCESKPFAEVRHDMALAVHLLQHLLATGAMFGESAYTALTRFRGDDNEAGPNLAAAVAGMCGILARISEARARRPDMRRRAAMFAIDAVIAFLVRINKQRAPTAALLDVSWALLDLERGVMPPLFKLEPTRSRPPDSIDRVMTKGIAAAAMSAMMKAGLGREEAARRVADQLRRDGVKLGGRRHLAGGTIASWRDQARAAVKDGLGVAMIYRLCMEGGRLHGPMAPPIGWKFDEQQREHYSRGALRQLSKSLSTFIQIQNNPPF
jgi:hypothetical protein